MANGIEAVSRASLKKPVPTLIGPPKVEVADVVAVITPTLITGHVVEPRAEFHWKAVLNATVAPVSVIGAVTEIVACLLLNVSQSVSVRHPVVFVSAVSQSIVKAPPTTERTAFPVSPVPAVSVPVATLDIAFPFDPYKIFPAVKDV